jgi:hypothetical protein
VHSLTYVAQLVQQHNSCTAGPAQHQQINCQVTKAHSEEDECITTKKKESELLVQL